MSDSKRYPKDHVLSQESIDALTELAMLVREIQTEKKVTFLPGELTKNMVLPKQKLKKRGCPKKMSVAELKGELRSGKEM